MEAFLFTRKDGEGETGETGGWKGPRLGTVERLLFKTAVRTGLEGAVALKEMFLGRGWKGKLPAKRESRTDMREGAGCNLTGTKASMRGSTSPSCLLRLRWSNEPEAPFAYRGRE
jgi:hypothetical protein